MNSKYKFIIDNNNDEFWFGLYPNNNNNQAIIESCKFDSEDMCKNEINIFKDYIKNNNLDNCDSKCIEIISTNNKYNFIYKINNREYSRKALVETKKQIEYDILLIYNNINAPIKYRKEL